MTPLNRAELAALCRGDETPHRARALALRLGALAPWWLSDGAIRLARGSGHPVVARMLGAEGLPCPPTDLGSCWVVCALTQPSPLLRPAVVLPVQWRKGEPCPSQLPPSLHRLADKVISSVGAIKDLPAVGDGWTLHPAFGGPPLTDDLFDTFDSGWASLTGGLIAAVLGLTPRTDVWASVAWADRPVVVTGLPAKLATAAAFGATAFFVHESQVAATPAPAGLRVVAVGPKVASGVTESLRDYFAESTDEPPKPVAGAADEDVQFERCRQYFLKLTGFAARSNDYYKSHLLEAIVRRYRRRFEAQAKGVRVRRFVTVVSFSPELAEIVVTAIQPERVLLLHTKDKKQEELALEYKTRLGKVVLEAGGTVECLLGPFDNATAPAEIAAHIAEFVAGVPDEDVVLDLKPGSKKMTYSVISAARPANHLLNMEPEFRDDRRNTPGTEIPELLPAISGHPAGRPA